MESPHHDGVAADRHTVTEVITRRAVGGEQLGALRPARRQAAGVVARKDVRRPAIGALVVVTTVSPHHDDVAADRHTTTEAIPHRAVSGQQLGALRPARRQAAGVVARKDVGRPAYGALVVVTVSPHHDGVAADRHTTTKVITRRAVGGEQLGALRPTRRQAAGVVAREDVRRAPVSAVTISPDDHCVAIDREAVTEVITLSAVGGDQLGNLRTAGIRV